MRLDIGAWLGLRMTLVHTSRPTTAETTARFAGVPALARGFHAVLLGHPEDWPRETRGALRYGNVLERLGGRS